MFQGMFRKRGRPPELPLQIGGYDEPNQNESIQIPGHQLRNAPRQLPLPAVREFDQVPNNPQVMSPNQVTSNMSSEVDTFNVPNLPFSHEQRNEIFSEQVHACIVSSVDLMEKCCSKIIYCNRLSKKFTMILIYMAP